jgi:hypothetical protein
MDFEKGETLNNKTKTPKIKSETDKKTKGNLLFNIF